MADAAAAPSGTAAACPFAGAAAAAAAAASARACSMPDICRERNLFHHEGEYESDNEHAGTDQEHDANCVREPSQDRFLHG